MVVACIHAGDLVVGFAGGKFHVEAVVGDHGLDNLAYLDFTAGAIADIDRHVFVDTAGFTSGLDDFALGLVRVACRLPEMNGIIAGDRLIGPVKRMGATTPEIFLAIQRRISAEIKTLF